MRENFFGFVWKILADSMDVFQRQSKGIFFLYIVNVKSLAAQRSISMSRSLASMNFSRNGRTRIATLAAVMGIVAIVPAMFGGLINIGVSDVNVLSADCEQQSAQVGIAGKIAGLFSGQEQDCDVVDLL